MSRMRCSNFDARSVHSRLDVSGPHNDHHEHRPAQKETATNDLGSKAAVPIHTVVGIKM